MGKNNKKIAYELVKEKFAEKNYKLLSEKYINVNSKLAFICYKHKDRGIQQVSFASLSMNECNCSECEKENRKEKWYESRNFKPITDDEFNSKHFEEYKNKLFDTVGNEYSLMKLSKKNKRTFLILKHNKCGYTYEVEQSKFFKYNNRCQNQKCKTERFRIRKLKTTETFKKEVFDLVGTEYEILSEYTGKDNDILFKHSTCGCTFYKTPHNFIAGQRCTHCVIPTKGEQKIITFLERSNENFTFQKSYKDLRGINGGLLSYDFYLDNQNILIEYQGQFHDGTAFKNDGYKWNRQQEHDKRKREYAKSHNIRLLEIWYWDFENIEEILVRELGINTSLAS